MTHEPVPASNRDPQPSADVAELRSRLASECAARLRAEAADAAKDAYLARLGHEWRTPLSAISAAADVLDGVASSDAPLAREACDIIRRQAFNLAARIDAVLDTTRVIGGTAVLSRCRVDLAGLAERVVASVQSSGLADHCELRLTRCDALVDIDPVRVAEAVTHLLKNALRFTPAEGAVEVEVGDDAVGPYLRVQDTGPGIEATVGTGSDRHHDPSGKIGFGLRFVESLMALHGGRIEVETSMQGTRVTLRFVALAACK